MFREVGCRDGVPGANGVSGMNLAGPDVVEKRAVAGLIQDMSNWRRPFARFRPCIAI